MEAAMHHLKELANVDWLLTVCVISAVTSVPLALRLVPPNPFYGFKTRFTRSRRDVWYDANAFMGWAMLAASLASAAVLLWKPFPLTAPGRAAAVVVFPYMLALLAGFVYLRHLRESVERR
jgi:hypothetical protein